MATITVKNIPDDVYEAFKRLAQHNRRSVNSEILYRMEMAVREADRNPEAILKRAALVRETLGIYTTNTEIVDAIDEGRA